MSCKKNIIIVGISLIILLLIVGILLFYNNNTGLHKINFDKLNSLLENEETFALCISRTTCSHCENYKPKLDNFAKKYGLKVYYIDIDKESDENQKKFKEIITFNDETPATIFIKNGIEITTANRIYGDVSENKIVEKFRTNGFIK